MSEKIHSNKPNYREINQTRRQKKNEKATQLSLSACLKTQCRVALCVVVFCVNKKEALNPIRRVAKVARTFLKAAQIRTQQFDAENSFCCGWNRAKSLAMSERYISLWPCISRCVVVVREREMRVANCLLFEVRSSLMLLLLKTPKWYMWCSFPCALNWNCFLSVWMDGPGDSLSAHDLGLLQMFSQMKISVISAIKWMLKIRYSCFRRLCCWHIHAFAYCIGGAKCSPVCFSCWYCRATIICRIYWFVKDD